MKLRIDAQCRGAREAAEIVVVVVADHPRCGDPQAEDADACDQRRRQCQEYRFPQYPPPVPGGDRRFGGKVATS